MTTARSQFGILLRQYRRDHYTQEELAHEIADRFVYSVTSSAISKYELGDRDPPASFVYYAARCLGLSAEQEHALIDAHFGDLTARFWDDWSKAAETAKKAATEEQERFD